MRPPADRHLFAKGGYLDEEAAWTIGRRCGVWMIAAVELNHERPQA
jgi:hypothetical protein